MKKISIIIITFLLILISFLLINNFVFIKKYHIGLYDTDYIVYTGEGNSVYDYRMVEDMDEIEYSEKIAMEVEMKLYVDFKYKTITKNMRVKESHYYMHVNKISGNAYFHLDYDNPNKQPKKFRNYSLKKGLYFEPNFYIEVDYEPSTWIHPSIDANKFSYNYNEEYNKKELYYGYDSIAESKYYDKYWMIDIDNS